MQRTLAWILPILLVTMAWAGTSGAQSEEPCPEGEECSPCPDRPPRERPSCETRCDDGPDHPSCAPPRKDRQENGTASPQPARPSRPPGGAQEKAPCEGCVGWEGDLRWISLAPSQEPPGFSQYKVDGFLLLRALSIGAEGPVELHRGNAVLMARAGDARIEVHDTPNGLVSIRTRDTPVDFHFPPDARVETEGQVARIQFTGGHEAFLRARDHSVADTPDGVRVTVRGFASLHLRGEPADPQQAEEKPAPVARERMERAIEKGALGAELVVRGPDAPSVRGVATAGDRRASVLAYDDVQIETEVPEVATPTDPLRITLSADLETGRAFSMSLDPALLPGLDPLDVPRTLEVRYFDVAAGVETEATIVMADDLDDVLEPVEGEVPEYWVVVDPNGIQVLFMVPTWSTHVFSLASLAPLAGLATDPPVLIGIAAGIGGALVAAAAVLWPRRRD